MEAKILCKYEFTWIGEGEETSFILGIIKERLRSVRNEEVWKRGRKKR